MIRELVIIDFIKPFLSIKEVKNGDEIYEFFKDIQNKQDFNSLYILNFLYKFICSDEVAKRKSSAREFEDLFSVLFGGIVTDTQSRKNLQYEVSEFFANVKDKIAGNKREKADILFPNNYAMSLKTLIAFSNLKPPRETNLTASKSTTTILSLSSTLKLSFV